MRIEIRNNSVLLDGYVNATGKDSKFIPGIKGKFKEQIVPEAFTRSDLSAVIRQKTERCLWSESKRIKR